MLSLVQVAIKTVVFQDRAASRAQQRAIAEAAITFSLSHPNVVHTYYHEIKPLEIPGGGTLDLVDKQDRHDRIQDWKLFLVQEYCEEGSLRKAIDRRCFLTPGGKTKLVRDFVVRGVVLSKVSSC
jgi:serine/threonine protein kinase